jgi:hypothetical protein
MIAKVSLDGMDGWMESAVKGYRYPTNIDRSKQLYFYLNIYQTIAI